MIKWLVSKFDGGIYTKRQALVIALFTIGLVAFVAYIVGWRIYCDIRGIYVPPAMFPQPYG